MASSRRGRTIAAPRERVWELIADPHHLPRWWPRVSRVEAVQETSFTEVLSASRGRGVRADFRVLESRAPELRRWAQEIEGTPFARILSSSEIELRLAPAGEGTRVTLELRQSPHGLFARFGTFLIRRAARAQLEEALDGLERACG